MNNNSRRPIEQLVIGLVATAIGIDVLATELPRVLPYLVVLAVIFIVLRLVLFLTRD